MYHARHNIHNYMKNTTRNTKTSTLTVTLLNKIERIRRIVTAITVVPKEARVPFGFNCWQSFLPSSEKVFITATPCVPHCENQKSALSHWLPATQILRLSNLIHILLFKLLAILHVHSWYSDLSARLWGPWSLNVLTISLVFLWVRGPAHYENTQCYFSVGQPRTVCAFESLTLYHILQPNTFLETPSPNFMQTAPCGCFEKFWNTWYHWIQYHPWSATNSAHTVFNRLTALGAY